MRSEQRYTAANGVVYVAVPITPAPHPPRCSDCDCLNKAACFFLVCSSDLRRDKQDVIWKKETSLCPDPNPL